MGAFIFSVVGETGFLLEARRRLGPEWQAVPCDALICSEHSSSEVLSGREYCLVQLDSQHLASCLVRGRCSKHIIPRWSLLHWLRDLFVTATGRKAKGFVGQRA